MKLVFWGKKKKSPNKIDKHVARVVKEKKRNDSNY